jgi:ketosteroid isomerase-like protein
LPLSPADAEEIVLQWFDAFNSRDLAGILACMHAAVDFRPLRLHGLASFYPGHDGVRAWFGDLERLEHRHRIEITEIRASADGQLIAVGTLSAADPAGPSSFWGLERFAGDKIVAAYHYVTEPDILRESGLLRP